MTKETVNIRLMKNADFESIVRIDEKIMKTARPSYYKMKFEKIFQSGDYIPTSLVAEAGDGTVVGFVMGELFIGQYGISEGAFLDTIGVDPAHQGKGIGERLVNEFIDHIGKLGVKKVNTLVDSGDARILNFFRSIRFTPSSTINMERGL